MGGHGSTPERYSGNQMRQGAQRAHRCAALPQTGAAVTAWGPQPPSISPPSVHPPLLCPSRPPPSPTKLTRSWFPASPPPVAVTPGSNEHQSAGLQGVSGSAFISPNQHSFLREPHGAIRNLVPGPDAWPTSLPTGRGRAGEQGLLLARESSLDRLPQLPMTRKTPLEGFEVASICL